MALLEISDEDLAFLKELAENMRTQDNRCTADPYFYTVVTTRLYPALEDTGNGPKQFTDRGDGDAYTADTKEAVIEVIQCEYELDEIPQDRIDEIMEYDTHEVWENRNVFLTEKACLAYIEKQRHNLDRRSYKPAFSYVDYADRNPEMARLVKILKSIK